MTDQTRDGRPNATGGPHAPFSSKELLEIGREISLSVPADESETTVRLLDVDPWKAHAFWSLAAEDAARVAAAGSDRALVLRFIDVASPSPGAPSHPSFDIAVEGRTNNWYVDLWKDARSYVVDLGLRSPDGGFTALARSNRIDLPPAGPSQNLDFREAEARPRPPAPEAPPESGTALELEQFRSLPPVREDAVSFPEVSVAALVVPDPVVEADPAVPPEPAPASVPPDEPVVPVPVSPGEPTVPVATAPASPAETAATPPPTNAAPVLVGMAEPFPRSDIVIPPLSAPQPFPEVSMDEITRYSDAADAAEEHALHALASPAPVPGPAERRAEPAAPPALPIESVAALSSFVNGPSVDLEINAEVVIYGRVRPGSVLSLYGRPVAVGADGAFSVRRPLPQGALVLPLVVQPGGKGD